MRLHVLGSNGTYPTPSRPGSGYLVTQNGTRVWVDTGPGTFAVLQEVLSLEELDGVVVSHIHPDHCVDLFALYHYFEYGPVQRRQVPVWAPKGVPERIGEFLSADRAHGLWEVFDFRPAKNDGEAELGDLGLRFAIADHPVPTVGVRMEGGGRSLVYSSDTGTQGGVGALAAGADLFLCEATYQGRSEDKAWPHHLTAQEAGSMAREAGAESLMLTHIWPTLDPERSVAEAEEIFGRSVPLAVTGMEVKV